jgi:hypothetical protein
VNGNFKSQNDEYFCHSCAPLATISEDQAPLTPLTEPQKQNVVDQIIENTNVPARVRHLCQKCHISAKFFTFIIFAILIWEVSGLDL